MQIALATTGKAGALLGRVRCLAPPLGDLQQHLLAGSEPPGTATAPPGATVMSTPACGQRREGPSNPRSWPVGTVPEGRSGGAGRPNSSGAR